MAPTWLQPSRRDVSDKAKARVVFERRNRKNYQDLSVFAFEEDSGL